MKENILRAWSHARVCGGDARMLNSRSHQFSPKLHLLSRWTETKRPETEAGFVQDFAWETGSSGKLGGSSAINQTMGKTQCSLLPQQYPEIHHPLRTARKSHLSPSLLSKTSLEQRLLLLVLMQPDLVLVSLGEQPPRRKTRPQCLPGVYYNTPSGAQFQGSYKLFFSPCACNVCFLWPPRPSLLFISNFCIQSLYTQQLAPVGADTGPHLFQPEP